MVAVCTVLLIVLSTLVVQTLVERGPVIFLNMAQISNGEVDAYITPNKAGFINFNAVRDALHKTPNSKFSVSPRKIFNVQLTSL